LVNKEYEMPAGPGESEFTDRKSVFLGHVMPVKSEEEALDFVKQMKKKYGDARHNVWAFALHDGARRQSDDGEPSGTGGAPVLDAILKKGLTDAVVVVVSEETGAISVSVGGILKRYLAAQTLDRILRAELCPPEDPKEENIVVRLRQLLQKKEKEGTGNDKK
jgi:putative IMPACT (imprinted ancient) family translation regulator